MPTSGTSYLVQKTLQVSLRVAKRFKNLGNHEILGNPKTGWRLCSVPSLPSRSKSLVIPAKSYADPDIKVICSCPIVFDFFTLFHYFFLRDGVLINGKELILTVA